VFENTFAGGAGGPPPDDSSSSAAGSTDSTSSSSSSAASDLPQQCMKLLKVRQSASSTSYSSTGTSTGAVDQLRRLISIDCARRIAGRTTGCAFVLDTRARRRQVSPRQSRNRVP
jgi:hypothetical protein